MELIQNRGFTQNQLKTVAAIAMLMDHIGAELFPQIIVLRIVGRLAFPIFSYFIYEGFHYTHNKKSYLLKIFSMGMVCVVVYYLYSGEIYGNVLITLSASIVVLYGITAFKQRLTRGIKDKLYGFVFLSGCFLSIYFICIWLSVDYGFMGVLLPVFAELMDKRKGKRNRYIALTGFSVGVFLLSVQMGGIQYFSLLAILLLAAYSGRRGSADMKSFFYWFYPAHLAAIGIVAMVA